MRAITRERTTDETSIELEFDLDGTGATSISTGIDFFDHMLEAFATHGRFDLSVAATGDFDHHIAEDAMIVLGQGLEEALGDKVGIRRAGNAIFPMDDALVLVAVDFGGRAYTDIQVTFNDTHLDDMQTDLYVHLLETMATNANCNLHVEVLRGSNDHHVAEAIAKGVGRAIAEATTVVDDQLPSSKGAIE